MTSKCFPPPFLQGTVFAWSSVHDNQFLPVTTSVKMRNKCENEKCGFSYTGFACLINRGCNLWNKKKDKLFHHKQMTGRLKGKHSCHQQL